VLPDISELRIIHADVFVAERGEHELSLERAVQQIGQIPQTLQAQLHAHAGSARQRVTATSSYSLVSPSYTERPTSRGGGASLIIADKYAEERQRRAMGDAPRRGASRRVAAVAREMKRCDVALIIIASTDN